MSTPTPITPNQAPGSRTASQADADVESLINEYYAAWQGTDEDRIMKAEFRALSTEPEKEAMASDARTLFKGPEFAGTQLRSYVIQNTSVQLMLRQFGFTTATFSSAEDFLASDVIGRTSCLILDVKMPGMSGPDLQRELATLGREIPIVFITASGDKAIRARLLSGGAVACLFKPFSEAALLDALQSALRLS